MAITMVDSDHGASSEFVSDTTMTHTPTGNLTANNYAIVMCVTDNVGAGEGETTDLSVTDSLSNTWSRLREQTESNTTAGTGVTAGIFMARMTSPLTTSDTITLTVSSAVTAKGMRLFEVSVGGGNTLQLAAAAGNNAAAGTSYAVTISGLSSAETLFVGMAAAEERTVNQSNVALDTGYDGVQELGGAGTGRFGTDGSPLTDHVCARAGYLITTDTGDTFDNNPPFTGRDRATIFVALREVAGAGGAALDPFGTMGFFGA